MKLYCIINWTWKETNYLFHCLVHPINKKQCALNVILFAMIKRIYRQRKRTYMPNKNNSPTNKVSFVSMCIIFNRIWNQTRVNPCDIRVYITCVLDLCNINHGTSAWFKYWLLHVFKLNKTYETSNMSLPTSDSFCLII